MKYSDGWGLVSLEFESLLDGTYSQAEMSNFNITFSRSLNVFQDLFIKPMHLIISIEQIKYCKKTLLLFSWSTDQSTGWTIKAFKWECCGFIHRSSGGCLHPAMLLYGKDHCCFSLSSPFNFTWLNVAPLSLDTALECFSHHPTPRIALSVGWLV